MQSRGRIFLGASEHDRRYIEQLDDDLRKLGFTNYVGMGSRYHLEDLEECQAAVFVLTPVALQDPSFYQLVKRTRTFVGDDDIALIIAEPCAEDLVPTFVAPRAIFDVARDSYQQILNPLIATLQDRIAQGQVEPASYFPPSTSRPSAPPPANYASGNDSARQASEMQMTSSRGQSRVRVLGFASAAIGFLIMLALVTNLILANSLKGHTVYGAKTTGISTTLTGTATSTPQMKATPTTLPPSDTKVIPAASLTWQYQQQGPIIYAPLANQSYVYVMDSPPGPNGQVVTSLTALNQATGTLAWSNTYGMVQVPPILSNGVIYLSSDAGNTQTAINAATGQTIWTFQLTAATRMATALADGHYYVVGATNMNASNPQFQVMAFDAGTGTPIWAHQINVPYTQDQIIIAGENKVFLEDSNSNIEALNATDGTRLWTAPAGSANTHPYLLAGNVLMTSGDALSALGVSNGQTIWQAQLPTVGSYLYNNQLYSLTTNCVVERVNPLTGQMQAIANLSKVGDCTGTGGAMLSNGILYVGGKQRIEAVNLANGAVSAQYTPAASATVGYIAHFVAASNGLIYYAFGLNLFALHF